MYVSFWTLTDTLSVGDSSIRQYFRSGFAKTPDQETQLQPTVNTASSNTNGFFPLDARDTNKKNCTLCRKTESVLIFAVANLYSGRFSGSVAPITPTACPMP